MLVSGAFALPSTPAFPVQAPTYSHAAQPRHSQDSGLLLPCTALAAAAAISSSRRRVARRASEGQEPASFFDAAIDRASKGRRGALAMVGAAGAAVTSSEANAKMVLVAGEERVMEQDGCQECNASGLTSCAMCEGSGQYRTWGTKYEKTKMMQYLTCPECNGVGEIVCQRCSGTGLSGKKLKGLMRDPIFAKVAYRLKKQRIDVNTVGKMRSDVKKAVNAAEKRKAEKEAEEAQGGS
mmetsp:Transcript_51045/g.95583  ORF Transcript_51045/g.95583 Transcript_51045/m.95583 type:complete len:238 (+) Transcript_51045:77-790(+)